MKGMVYLVGAGPGDPGLITQRGVEVLRRADVVIYDRLLSHRVLQFARRDAHFIDVGHNGKGKVRPQRVINRLMAHHAGKGRIVARLKAGDPFVFARGSEEAEWLAKQSIPFEVVPGVTAAIASATYAGIPLTHGEEVSNVTFVTGHLKPGTAFPEIPPGGTVAIYMAVKSLPHSMRTLLERGWSPDTPAVVIECGTTPRQRLVEGTVATIAERAREARIRPPAVAIAGRVVHLRGLLSWFESRPLRGLRIVVTRSREQSSEFSNRLLELGADAIEYPTIEIQPLKRWRPVDAVLRDVSHYDAVVFTSQNTVPIVFERWASMEMDARSLAGVRIAAVGPATAAALARHGVRADWIADEFTVAALAKKIASTLPAAARILHPGADKRSPILERHLLEAGLHVRNVDVYRISRPRHVPKLKEVDLVTFASAQTARNFSTLCKLRPPAVCIGPVTAQAVRDLGFPVVAVATPHTISGLIQAIMHWKKGASA